MRLVVELVGYSSFTFHLAPGIMRATRVALLNYFDRIATQVF